MKPPQIYVRSVYTVTSVRAEGHATNHLVTVNARQASIGTAVQVPVMITTHQPATLVAVKSVSAEPQHQQEAGGQSQHPTNAETTLLIIATSEYRNALRQVVSTDMPPRILVTVIRAPVIPKGTQSVSVHLHHRVEYGQEQQVSGVLMMLPISVTKPPAPMAVGQMIQRAAVHHKEATILHSAAYPASKGRPEAEQEVRQPVLILRDG